MENIRTPEVKLSRAITKPGAARTRRIELGISGTVRSSQEITLGHSGGNAPGFAQPGPL